MTRKEQILTACKDFLSEYPNIDQAGLSIGFLDGAVWADKHPYWRPSTEHPPVDVEVVALEGRYLRVCFAHIVKDKKNVIDFDGWNISDIRWWMPIQDITEIEEDEEVE